MIRIYLSWDASKFQRIAWCPYDNTLHKKSDSKSFCSLTMKRRSHRVVLLLSWRPRWKKEFGLLGTAAARRLAQRRLIDAQTYPAQHNQLAHIYKRNDLHRASRPANPSILVCLTPVGAERNPNGDKHATCLFLIKNYAGSLCPFPNRTVNTQSPQTWPKLTWWTWSYWALDVSYLINELILLEFCSRMTTW